MTISERLAYAEASVAAPRAFIAVGLRAAIDQAANRPREWGEDWRGYGLRAGSNYAENFIGQVLEQSIALKWHEDNRYFASGRRGIARRLGYAIASSVLARRDDGSRRLSYSVLTGAAGSAFIARAWQPPSTTTAADGAVGFGLNMAVMAGLNVAREFSPRFVARLLR